MTRIRVLMTSYYMPSESKIGVGHQVHLLANALVELGLEVTVATPCVATDGARYDTLTLPVQGAMRTFRWAFTLRRLDLSRFDVLHAHGDDYWMWRRRVPAHIRTMHGSCFSEALRVPGFKEKLRMVALGLGETLATAVADETVAVSRNTLAWMPWVKRVIPNGADLARLQGDGSSRSGYPSILFVGTYENRKRGSLLQRVFVDDVLPAIPTARLRMVCSDAPPAPGVDVLGRLAEDDLYGEYRNAWVFCLPSSYEGFGIPYIEAMAAGCAVVATPNPGARELSADGSAIRISSAEDLGECLRTLLTDDAEREALAAAGSAQARNFDIHVVASRYLDLYREVAARNQCSLIGGKGPDRTW